MRGFLLVVLAAIMLSGCASAPERDRNMVIGAGIGAGVGALIGSASGGPPGGWAGAAIGAATGGTIGAMVGHQACYIRNKRGELWQVPCEDTRVRSEACFVGSAIGGLSQVPCSFPERPRS
jgi:uncharacterized membrane protein